MSAAVIRNAAPTLVDEQVLRDTIAELSRRKGLGARLALQQIRARYLALSLKEAS